ncbi:hypothetical protein Tco_1361683 [Tanacetum coccineum]
MFLKEDYVHVSLVDPNPVYVMRRKLLNLVILGRRGLHSGDYKNFAHSTSTMEVNQQDNNEEECKQLGAKTEPLIQASRNSPEISKYAPSTSRLDISTSDVDDAENLSKQLEAKIEPLIHALKGFTRYNGKHRYSRRRALERQRSKVKRKLAKVWKELLLLKQESQFKYAKRWSLNREIKNLFSVALKLTVPEYKDEESSIRCSVQDDGDYHCEDVLMTWPRLREEGKAHLGPRRVGWQIKRNVQVQQPEMVHREATPFVFDIGFVNGWLSLHKLLRDGADTWAPPLFIKSYLVNIYFPTCDIADLSNIDSLRPVYTSIYYCRVRWIYLEEHDKFQTIRTCEDVLIFPNAEGQDEPLIRAKRDSSDPMEDLKNLCTSMEDLVGKVGDLASFLGKVEARVSKAGKLSSRTPALDVVPWETDGESEDALFPLARIDVQMKLAYFWEMDVDTKRETLPLKGKDGDVRMYYVLLKDAMDCAIEVTYDFKEDRKVQVAIFAYYGSDFFFDTDEDPCVKNFYTALLYDCRFNSKIAGKVGEVPLKRSIMSVPAKGSIVIKARLHDSDSNKHGYFNDNCTFDVQPRGVFKKEIHGSCSCCSLSMRLVWSQGQNYGVVATMRLRYSSNEDPNCLEETTT